MANAFDNTPKLSAAEQKKRDAVLKAAQANEKENHPLQVDDPSLPTKLELVATSAPTVNLSTVAEIPNKVSASVGSGPLTARQAETELEKTPGFVAAEAKIAREKKMQAIRDAAAAKHRDIEKALDDAREAGRKARQAAEDADKALREELSAAEKELGEPLLTIGAIRSLAEVTGRKRLQAIEIETSWLGHTWKSSLSIDELKKAIDQYGNDVTPAGLGAGNASFGFVTPDNCITLFELTGDDSK